MFTQKRNNIKKSLAIFASCFELIAVIRSNPTYKLFQIFIHVLYSKENDPKNTKYSFRSQ